MAVGSRGLNTGIVVIWACFTIAFKSFSSQLKNVMKIKQPLLIFCEQSFFYILVTVVQQNLVNSETKSFSNNRLANHISHFY